MSDFNPQMHITVHEMRQAVFLRPSRELRSGGSFQLLKPLSHWSCMLFRLHASQSTSSVHLIWK